MEMLPLYCTSPRNTADLLAEEVRRCGGRVLHEHPAGVSFEGTIETAYRVCMWSRVGSRVLLQIGKFNATSSDMLYDGMGSIVWRDHVRREGTFALSATITGAPWINSNFAVLRAKDAIADYFSAKYGKRPSVSTGNPDVRIHLHIHRDTVESSIDLSGESLHRRGYRRLGGPATLKENVAAALLLRAEWPGIAEKGGAFVDPMCGSGTLAIEAALMAGDVAPGILRKRFGFHGWPGHDDDAWRRVRKEADQRRREGETRVPLVTGYDRDPAGIAAARANSQAAGVDRLIRLERRELESASPPHESHGEGLVAVNPPYGKRVGTEGELSELYSRLGSVLRTHFGGWRAVILTADEQLGKSTGLRAERVHVLFNGSIRCIAAHFRLYTEDERAAAQRETDGASGGRVDTYRTIFTNRIRKNIRSLRKWRKDQGVSCYRVYDADSPEFSAAVDVYEDTWAHVQEYAAPSSVDPHSAEERLRVIVESLPESLGVEASNVFVKTRERQRHGTQYDRMAESGIFYEIHEGGLAFLANFSDYLDTGIFLDHRITRSRLREEARGRRFLNLFSYTGTATVFAADGGASSTTSVDTSNTYTKWAQENMILNGFVGEQHRFIREEARSWLSGERGSYDLIFLDPPTFSRSKSYRGVFQVQSDHLELIRMSVDRLSDDGVLYFSTNYRNFSLDSENLSGVTTEDLTAETIPPDFKRNPRIHKLWRIRKHS